MGHTLFYRKRVAVNTIIGFREVQRILTSFPLFSIIPRRNTVIHRNEESHTPTALRHRENIGRIGSLRVF